MHGNRHSTIVVIRRRAFVHLKHGTSPSRKARNLKDLRRYLNIATLDNDGLIIVRKDIPFQQARSLIVVPVGILHGVVTALHTCTLQASYKTPIEAFVR